MLHDLRHAFRSLLKTPGFALAAVFALALGIGANTAVFSVVNGVLLRPLGYADPDRLVVLYAAHPQQGEFNSPSYPDFRDWRDAGDAAGALEGMAFLRSETLLLRRTEGALRINGAHVSDGFFPLLGTKPLLGGRSRLTRSGRVGRACSCSSTRRGRSISAAILQWSVGRSISAKGHTR